MKNDLTQITVVLDRSGSMETIRRATIDGFNEFVEGQKGVVGEANLTLIQFDSENSWEPVFESKPVNQVPKLTVETFVPRGGTPLHDAIGRTIVDLGARLSKLPESERPGKVIVVIMTDGLENASQEFKSVKIAEMIKHQKENYQWEFVFIGANQDAILTGEQLGIDKNHSVVYFASSFDPSATTGVLRSTSANIAAVRSGTVDTFKYSEQDRETAKGKGN